jgi:hypothetical protein
VPTQLGETTTVGKGCPPYKNHKTSHEKAATPHDEFINGLTTQTVIQLGLKPIYAIGQRYAKINL